MLKFLGFKSKAEKEQKAQAAERAARQARINSHAISTLGQTNSVNALALPEERLASGSTDNTIKIWDPAIPNDEKTAEPLLKVVFGNAVYASLPHPVPLLTASVTASQSVFVTASVTSMHSVTTVLKASSATVEELLRQLTESEQTRAEVSILKGRDHVGSQTFMTPPPKAPGTETVEEKLRRLEQVFACSEEPVHHVTAHTLTHQKRVKDVDRLTASSESTSVMASVSSRGMFAGGLMVAAVGVAVYLSHPENNFFNRSI